MELSEKLLTKKRLFTGKVINLDLEEVCLPNGQHAQREIVHHHGAVGIMALIDNQLLLVKQWREPMQRLTLEIPAGKIEPGQQNLEAEALRELNEETGYQCDSLKKLGGFYSSPGFTDEYLTLFYAPQLEKATHKRPLDDDEFLNLQFLTWEKAQEQIAAGLICDAKTLMAILIWQNLRLQEQCHG
ncbi:MAG: NUDIX hydrolase [Lactobacillus sp.]|uniref:NUDIX hydrolase n=1 Tax=Bombilactobacillus bombi TaxID=1303590 RepID=UPI0035EBE4D0|nr:NUDIX hydrolase [Lactobacillus sp.]